MKYDDDLSSWIRELRVGDTVESCSLERLQIVEIRDRSYSAPQALYRFAYTTHPSLSYVFVGLVDMIAWVFRKFGYRVVYDRELKLSDGSTCSAKYCCDPSMRGDERCH